MTNSNPPNPFLPPPEPSPPLEPSPPTEQLPPLEPSPPAKQLPPQRQSNRGLIYAIVGLAAVIVVALGVIGGYFMANGGDRSASPDTVAAGDSSSSTAEPTQSEAETYTETVTATASPEPSRGRTSAPKTTTPSRHSGSFGKRAFGLDRDDIDASGWVGSTARCSGGYYARVLAETSSGKVVICESSYDRKDRYYIGDFGDISESPDAYPVESYSAYRVTAVNMDYVYTVTPQSVIVTQDGEQIFADNVVTYATLNAG